MRKQKSYAPGPSQRQLRLGERIKQVLGKALSQGLLDPQSGEAVALTLTEVQISGDLRRARVFFVPFGEQDAERLRSALDALRPQLSRLLAKQLYSKFTPKMSFHADTHFERVQRLEATLRGLTASGGAAEVTKR